MGDVSRSSATAVLPARADAAVGGPGATWVALAPAEFCEAAELERRVLASLDDLESPVDYVVTHDPTGLGGRACVVVRALETGPRVSALARHLYARLDGTTVVLSPSSRDRATVVLGRASSMGVCWSAVKMSRDGIAGRCVRFPGYQRLTGLVSVRRLVERSAISRVTGLAGLVSPEDLVDVRSPLRPLFEGGQLVLRTVADDRGVLLPDG